MNIDGNIYYPYIINYTEKDFGGELETTPDYKGFYITSLLKENENWAYFLLIHIPIILLILITHNLIHHLHRHITFLALMTEGEMY
jgi:ABC-type microcin C transport system permease subunit YejE